MARGKTRFGPRCVAPLGLFILAVVGIPGCWSDDGVKTYPVKVKVSFPDGGTVEGAIVAFHSVSDPDGGDKYKTYSAIGKVQADGTCQLTTVEPGDGAVAGKHRVTVGPPLLKVMGDPDEMPTPPVLIHPRFKSIRTSGLEFTVTPEGPNEFFLLLEKTSGRQ